jgi:hypothetical protein
VYRYFAGSRPDGRCVLVRFDRDPRTDLAAIGDRYINDGGTWVPDTTGLLGDLVRYFDGYNEVAEADVIQMKMRIAVETVGSNAPRGDFACRDRT